MSVRSLGWWGVRMPAADAMNALYRDVLQLEVIAAHAALTEADIEFLYDRPQRAHGRAWQHFRAPDGNVYEIIGPDDLPHES
jgi:hypothetical protein